VEEAIRGADGPALCAYLMAGYPDRATFARQLVAVSRVADLVEVGVPFSDPIADGRTIQQAGFEALAAGTTLDAVLELVADAGDVIGAPCLLMGYYNPFLAHGLDRLAGDLASAGIAGLVVPDLPLEESGPLEKALGPGPGLVRLATPTTPPDRLRALGKATAGFLYAVTSTGVTGGNLEVPAELLTYLDRARRATDRPVLAGFGVRERSQVAKLADHVDGVVVGSALIEAISLGLDPSRWLLSLRG
jgi:tryptophan synthase alpha chain